MSLTSKQRAALRSAANTMDPVYQIGKGEIDDTLKQGIADCIAARELIKVKVLENSEYSAREPDGLSLRRLQQRADPQPHPPQ